MLPIRGKKQFIFKHTAAQEILFQDLICVISVMDFEAVPLSKNRKASITVSKAR